MATLAHRSHISPAVEALNTKARGLLRTIRAESSVMHPARIGLGTIINRMYALETTDADIAALEAMLEAVRA